MVPGWLLSTGTLRILALLACLRHPDPPPLLVVEEIENGLDPRTIHLLVEEIPCGDRCQEDPDHRDDTFAVFARSPGPVAHRRRRAGRRGTRLLTARQGATPPSGRSPSHRGGSTPWDVDQESVMPRVGILVECGPDGLEVHVCGRICELLQRRTGIVTEHTIVPMTNKLGLLEGCGPVTRSLFDRGCERVVILWDERPPGPIRTSVFAGITNERGSSRNSNVRTYPIDRSHSSASSASSSPGCSTTTNCSPPCSRQRPVQSAFRGRRTLIACPTRRAG